MHSFIQLSAYYFESVIEEALEGRVKNTHKSNSARLQHSKPRRYIQRFISVIIIADFCDANSLKHFSPRDGYDQQQVPFYTSFSIYTGTQSKQQCEDGLRFWDTIQTGGAEDISSGIQQFRAPIALFITAKLCGFLRPFACGRVCTLHIFPITLSEAALIAPNSS